MSDGMQDDSFDIQSDDHMEHKEKDFISLLSCTPGKLLSVSIYVYL